MPVISDRRSSQCVFPICGRWRVVKTVWQTQLNEQNLNSLIGEFHGNHKGKDFFLICVRWHVVITVWQNQLNEQNFNSLIGEFHGNHKGNDSSM